MSYIPGIAPLAPLAPISKIGDAGRVSDNQSVSGSADNAKASGTDFSKFLTDALQKVDSLQKDADAATAGLVTGQVQDVHTVMIALEKANLAMSMTVEVRNKVLDAYSEIMRMQI